MVGLGVLGYIMRKHFPMSPLILGFVLGEMLENLRAISNGNLAILWESGVTKTLLILVVAVAGGTAAAASET